MHNFFSQTQCIDHYGQYRKITGSEYNVAFMCLSIVPIALNIIFGFQLQNY